MSYLSATALYDWLGGAVGLAIFAYLASLALVVAVATGLADPAYAEPRPALATLAEPTDVEEWSLWQTLTA